MHGDTSRIFPLKPLSSCHVKLRVILDLTNQLMINYQFFDNYAREGTCTWDNVFYVTIQLTRLCLSVPFSMLIKPLSMHVLVSLKCVACASNHVLDWHLYEQSQLLNKELKTLKTNKMCVTV